MAATSGGLLSRALTRYAAFAHAPSDGEEERLRKTVNVLLTTLILLLVPAWILTYLALGRPLAAAIPAAYALISVGGLLYVFIPSGRGYSTRPS